MAIILFKRGTRAQLNTAASGSLLNLGEPYLITDEGRLAVGTAAGTYETVAKEVHGHSGTLDANARLAIMHGTYVYGTRRAINFVDGPHVGFVLADIPGNERVDVTAQLYGSALGVAEDDGSPSVANVSEIRFSGATVEQVSSGVARVTVPVDDTFPAGAIVAYGGSTAPDGWLLCDGSAVSRATYADLFAVIGTSHGPGDGSTTFNVPDLRDRFVYGKGATSAVGDTGGAATHLHAIGLAVAAGGTNARETGDTLTPDALPVSGHLTVDHYHSASVTGDTGSASSLPPYLVEVFIIKASGTPSAATPHNTLASRDASGAHPASAISFTPAGSISATTVQAAIEEVAAEAGGGGSALTVKEDDGSPSVANVTELRFSGATVTDNGAGVVTVSGLAGPAGLGNFAESAVPNMTSNTDPAGTVSASSNYFTAPPWRVFSHDRLGWVSDGIVAPAWVQYQFTSAKTIRVYEVMSWSIDTWPARALAAWHLDGSNDGSTWTELDARTHAWGWSQWAAESYPIASPAAYTHYRLVITAIKAPSEPYVGLQSLRLFE